MTAKTFGNHGGDESESSGPVTPTEDDDQLFVEEESYLSDEFIIIEGQLLGKTSLVYMDDFCIDEDQHGSVRLIGVAINSDVADFGSKVPDSGSLGVYELWKPSFVSHIKTIMWFKKESMFIQRRLWDPEIKKFFRHHLEDNVVVKEWE
ncbi:hypothetical protein Tco_1289863 [Tanacetum coccineum]